MTKEELQIEAYKWTEENISVGISMYNPSIEMYCGQAYKDGAEPREKRIEELETENRLLGERCNQLLKDKGDLTDKCRQLEQQIEKMKVDVKQGQSYWNSGEMQYDLYQRLLDKWEIRK
jgi:predicted RNase H-like nuclease (RuvC/YqgF family)